MANGYVAKFGDSIRRLAALDLAAQGNPNLAGAGPQPVTGAFDVAPQYQQRDPAKEPLNQAGAFPEAAEGSAQQPGAISAPPAGPFGTDANPQKLWDEMPAEARKKVIRQIESKGIDINKVYDEKVAAGEITPPERVLTKGERLSVLAETLLRHARNVGQGQPGPAASANAILETQGRRGGLEQAAAQKEAEIKEVLRQENRTDTKEATKRAQELEDAKRTRGETIVDDRRKRRGEVEDREDKQTHERELAQAERAAAAAREKGKNVQVFTGADGEVVMIDKDNNKVIPLEVESEETVATPGQRGRPGSTATTKVKTPLKGIPTNAAGGTATLDPDTVLNRVIDEAKRISEDRKAMREITEQAKAEGRDPQDLLMERAKKNVGSATSGQAVGDDPLGIL
jgi:hypothetical protein